MIDRTDMAQVLEAPHDVKETALDNVGLWHQFKRHEESGGAPWNAVLAALFGVIELVQERGGDAVLTPGWGAVAFLNRIELHSYSIFGELMEPTIRLNIRHEPEPLPEMTDKLALAVLTSFYEINQAVPGATKWDRAIFISDLCTLLVNILSDYDRRLHPPVPPKRPTLRDRVLDLINPVPQGPFARQSLEAMPQSSLYNRYTLRRLEHERHQAQDPIEKTIYAWLNALQNRRGEWLVAFPADKDEATSFVDAVAGAVAQALNNRPSFGIADAARRSMETILDRMRAANIDLPGETDAARDEFVVRLHERIRSYHKETGFERVLSSPRASRR